MLAATPSQESRVLTLFQLALRLVGQSEQPISPEMHTYFNRVLHQAKALNQDPSSITGGLLPEAIQLALNMRELEELRGVLSDADDLASVSPALADSILNNLERRVAS